MSKLYIVATPIGNLEDITLRALNVLKEADLILCEDTRVTKRLLDRYEVVNKQLTTYNEQKSGVMAGKVIQWLKEGKNLALVSDAGTPGISDPGQQLISVIARDEAISNSVEIIPIPGPNAAIAALSISGFNTDEFLFLGFPPHKKGRQTFFENVLAEAEKRTVVFYESTHRITKALEKLDELLKAKSYQLTANCVVCREITKKFETVYRGAPSEVLEKLKNDIIKGEFVVVIKNG